MRALLATIVALGLVAWSATAARAQEDKAAARRLLSEGDQELRRADRLRDRGREERAIEGYEKALASYRAAYEAFASPKIYFPIAQVEERLGMDLEAYGHYRTVVRDAADLDDNVRAQVERRLSELETRLLLLTIAVEPEGAAVVIDGTVVGTAPLAGPVPLFPGEYSLTVTKSGFVTYESAIAGGAGEALTERVDLDRKGGTTPQVEDDDDAPIVASESPPKPRRKGELEVIVGASVTGSLVVAATVTGVLAVSKKGDFDDAATAEERSDAADSGEALALTTDLLWLAAIGAGAATAYYYFRVYRADGEEDPKNGTARVRETWLAPYAHGSGAGLAVGGRF